MLTISLRDLQYRKRQFAIAITGAALVFAMALMLTGVREGFNTEADRTVSSFGADGWVVAEGVTGPFTTGSGLPASTAEKTATDPGVEDATPFAAFGDTAQLDDGERVTVNVVGVVPGALGAPAAAEGQSLAAEGGEGPVQIVADERLGADVGDEITIAGTQAVVTGTVSERTYFGGVPITYMRLADAQRIAFDGAPLATGIPFTGELQGGAPAGTTVLTNEEVKADMKRVLEGAISTIDFLRILMWIVAAVIIGTVIYLSALERVTDFAVLKAVGGESRSLAIGLSIQAVIASLLAALLAIGLAFLMKPGFPLPVSIDALAYVSLVVIAVVVGVLASLAALRRVLKVDPALAFG